MSFFRFFFFVVVVWENREGEKWRILITMSESQQQKFLEVGGRVYVASNELEFRCNMAVLQSGTFKAYYLGYYIIYIQQ